jgi:Protein of unknown function (DUF2894)
MTAPDDGRWDDAIAALRQRGAAQRDSLRFHQIEAMSRRAQRHAGAARALIDERLAELVAACGAAVDAAAATQPERADVASGLGPLGTLLAQTGRPGSVPGVARSAGLAAPPTASGGPELKALRQFRGTWSRLSVERRLTQSLAAVPGNAGPLNTQRLLHQALAAMHDASPAYLHAFIGHADALLRLEAALQAPPAPAPETRGKPPRRPPKR